MQYERIIDILDPNAEDREDPPPVNANTLNIYFQYLLPRLRPGLLMTGNDTCGYFSWEERFFFGFGDEALHKKMRRKKASSEDKFKFMELLEEDAPTGLIAKLKRISDNQIFHIPLMDLEVCEKKIAQWQIVDDYVTWIVNLIG